MTPEVAGSPSPTISLQADSSLSGTEAPAGAAGAAVAWGENFHGQLGTFYRDLFEESPVAVEGQDDIACAPPGAPPWWPCSRTAPSASGAGRYGSIGDGGRKASWEQGRAT